MMGIYSCHDHCDLQRLYLHNPKPKKIKKIENLHNKILKITRLCQTASANAPLMLQYHATPYKAMMTIYYVVYMFANMQNST